MARRGESMERETSSWVGLIRQSLRRIPLFRVIVTLVVAVLALQAAVIAVLTLIAKRRTQRLPPGGFPHLGLPEMAIGENRLRIFSYGEHLYDAMLEAIDNARQTIYFETYLWKDDAIGRTFKERLTAKAEQGVAVYVIFDTFGNLVVPRRL